MARAASASRGLTRGSVATPPDYLVPGACDCPMVKWWWVPPREVGFKVCDLCHSVLRRVVRDSAE